MKPWGYLITDGTYGVLTKALVLVPASEDASSEIKAGVEQFAADTGTPVDQVCVNPIGERLNWPHRG
jgi:hypothetical protein